MDLAILACAERHHGVVTHSQLVALGMSGPAITRPVRQGRLQRLYPAVYAVGHSALTHSGHQLAAVLAHGPRAVLAYRSAGRLWGIVRSAETVIEVAAPRSREPKRGVLTHTTRRLDEEDRSVIDGIPVTGIARTIVDLAEVLSDGWLERAVHEAEVRGLFDLVAIEEALGRVPGRRGRFRLRRVLARYRPEPHELASSLERRLYELCRRFDLPQCRPAMVDGVQIDLYWPEAKLAVEVDGTAVHHTRRAFHADRARDRFMAARGIQVLRVTAPDFDDPAGLAAQILRIYRLRVAPRRVARLTDS